MNVLIVGYGSIGQRHAELFEQLDCKVGIVSRRDSELSRDCYHSVAYALAASTWDIIVIANRTAEHFFTLNDIIRLKYTGIVLVEKPIFDELKELGELPFRKVLVSYNLRFHPGVQKLRHLLIGEKTISAHFYVGQYLPGWRPGQDYRDSYSASKEMGGGVLRDLSHELDLLQYLTGRWTRLSAIGGTYSHLQIDSDDIFSILLQTDRCPVATVQLNYLDRITQRQIIVNTDRHTFSLDLIKGTLNVDGVVESFDLERNATYLVQHRQLLNEDFTQICSLEEGMNVLRMIEAIESASIREVWMQNEVVHDMR
ncbi:Gfo/Idh/MocA family protein [Cohnella sp. GCM10027633]|uniref:Gfo/Idh/MocA family protein n=1 Tax=unclassified Cohnella TaxID=2636738 RepID=UPI00362DC4A6